MGEYPGLGFIATRNANGTLANQNFTASVVVVANANASGE
jgi:hypothetical protein